MSSVRHGGFENWLSLGLMYPTREVEIVLNKKTGKREPVEKLVFRCKFCPTKPVITNYDRPVIDRAYTHMDSDSHRMNKQNPNCPRISPSDEVKLPSIGVWMSKVEKEAFFRGGESIDSGHVDMMKKEICELHACQKVLDEREDEQEKANDALAKNIETIEKKTDELSAEQINLKEFQEELYCICTAMMNDINKIKRKDFLPLAQSTGIFDDMKESGCSGFDSGDVVGFDDGVGGSVEDEIREGVDDGDDLDGGSVENELREGVDGCVVDEIKEGVDDGDGGRVEERDGVEASDKDFDDRVALKEVDEDEGGSAITNGIIDGKLDA